MTEKERSHYDASSAGGDAARRVHAVVYDRTSGDEQDSQDVKAQTAQTVYRAGVAGFDVVATFSEEKVSGDSAWSTRQALGSAMREAVRRGAVLVVREASRLWRGRPSAGLGLLETIRDLTVLDAPVYDRRAGVWLDDSPEAEVMRFFGLWFAWAEKMRAVTRSAFAMAEIKAGRRKTRSGEKPGRKPKDISGEHLAVARAVIEAGGSLIDAREKVRQARGYYGVTDPEARKRRDVGKGTLGRALGLRGYVKAQNDGRPRIDAGSPGEGPPRVESVVGQPSPTAASDGRGGRRK